jgi:predicted enzyme related to lactoylglutathione lyase
LKVIGRVIHFEIHADDVKRASDFYKKAFGWKIQKWNGPLEYMLVMTGDEKTPGIDGGIMQRTGPNSVWNTIDVKDLDVAIKKIEKAGGKVVDPKREVPQGGWMAYCQDTEGNIFGVMQAMPGAKM